MTTTAAWLASLDSARLAFAVVFEGLPYVYTTTSDTSGMATAWASTSWATGSGGIFRSGMRLFGTVKQEIELFTPRIKPDTVKVHIVDPDDALAAVVFKHVPAVSTYLTADLDNNDTTATVLDTTSFSASGTVYLGLETIAYTGKSATTLTGLTRAKYALNATATPGDFAPYHAIGDEVYPKVSTTPVVHYNRPIAIYLHHYENGAWSTQANALKVWSGRVKSVSDNGDRSLSFECRSILEMLEQHALMGDQFTGSLREGVYLTDPMTRIVISEYNATDAVDNPEKTGNIATGSPSSVHDIMESIQSVVTAMRVATTIAYTWAIDTVDGRVRISAQVASAGSTAGANLWIGLHPRVWSALGFTTAAPTFVSTTGSASYQCAWRHLWGIATSNGMRRSELVADTTPTKYNAFGNELILDGATGIWSNQTTLPAMAGTLPTGTEGFVQVGSSKLYAVSYADGGGGQATLTIKKDVTEEFGFLGFEPRPDGAGTVLREGQTGELIVRQVWVEDGDLADVILRLLLSTGTASYNSSTYDLNGSAMGAGVPYSLIDVNSFLALGQQKTTLIIPGSTPLTKVLESALAVAGLYLVWSGGQFSARPIVRNGSAMIPTFALTEANKARPDDRLRSEYSADGIINGVDLHYNQGWDGKFRDKIILRDVVSASDFGQRRTVKIEAWGVNTENRDAALQQAAVALALFSRPMTTAERTINYNLVGVVPTDTVTVTDNYFIDPETGTRGVSGLPAWVLGVQFDFETMSGRVQLAIPVESPVDRRVNWAPAARVDDTAANGGYNAGTKVLTCYANRYTRSADGVDAASFAVGDRVRVRELSPADPGSPTLWSDIVAARSGNTVTLTTGLGGWSSSLKYILEYDTVLTSGLTAAQLQHAFIADDGDDSTGYAENDAYEWAGQPPVCEGSVAAVDYSQQYVRPSSTVDDTGRPLTVGDWYEHVMSLNNMLGYKSRTCVVNQPLATEASHTSNATWKRIYGPIWVPCMGRGRGLRWRAVLRASSATYGAEIRVITSGTMVRGTADTSTVYDSDTQVTSSVSTISTTNGWTGEIAHVPVVVGAGSVEFGCWLTAELRLKNSGGAATAYCSQLTVYEVGL